MSNNKKYLSRKSASGVVRIIGGQWRSRKISVEVAPGLRPTGDRVRETLFNWLGTKLEGAHCLDIYAGSGVLSLEALSRGAGACTAIDNNLAVIKCLRSNAEALDAELNIISTDAISYLRQGPLAQKFDVVFIDPPFTASLCNETCELLEDKRWLANEALIYCEMPAATIDFSAPANWLLKKDKVAGDVRYMLYSRIESARKLQ